jgi:hypothetical protein
MKFPTRDEIKTAIELLPFWMKDIVARHTLESTTAENRVQALMHIIEKEPGADDNMSSARIAALRLARAYLLGAGNPGHPLYPPQTPSTGDAQPEAPAN